MKKFTEILLLGGQHYNNVLRKIGLSMVAILMLAGTAFSQIPSDGAQDTYYVLAETVTDCYRLDNDYEVQVSMRDFVRIDSFNLVLTYDNSVYSYNSVSSIHGQLAGMTVTESSGTITMNWDSGDSPQTISPDNDTTDVFVLHFSVDGFLHSYNNVNNYVFDTDLNWSTASSVWNWNASNQQSEILTWFIEDGSITATQKWEEIVLDNSSATCDGSDAIVTVTTPANVAGMKYSFNGNTQTTNPTAHVTAPSTNNTVEVMDATCTSYMEKFDVSAAAPLSYTTDEYVYVDCSGGLGDIEIFATGGSTPYTYFIVPTADWAQVVEDFGQATSKNERNAVVAQYATTNNVLERYPGIYYVAVQDANDCIDLGLNDGDWWEMVEVLDEIDAWDLVVTEIVHEQCADFDNGAFSMSIAGGTPSVDGYTVWVNSVLQTGKTDSLVFTDLAPGNYDVVVQDSLNCTTDTRVVILPKDPITFEVDHTDASCDLNIGTLWIEPGTVSGGSGTYDYWVYSTLPDFSVADTIYNITDTATGLAPHVYYSRVFDSEGCFADYRNNQGDNAIKILSIDFDVTHTQLDCNGDLSTITVTVNNPGNHVFKFNIDGGAWQTSNVFEDLGAATYLVGVWDTTINCENYWPEEILEIEILEVEILDLLTLEPTCHGAHDGNIQVRGSGGTPFTNAGGDNYYEYKFDDRAWAAGGVDNTFATGTGMHTIIIRDAKGCSADVEYDLYLTPNVIDIEDVILECNGDVTELDGDTVSWIHEPDGKAQGEREPVIYWSATTDVAEDIVAEGNVYWPLAVDVDETTFAVGTYFFVGKDEWGCYSNVDEVDVEEPEAFIATATKVDNAGCYGVTDGKIKLEAWKGVVSDACDLDSRYEYLLTQSAEILNHATWWNQVNWSDFQNDDPANDSVMVIDVQKGTYYLAVRDCCAKEGRPDLIQGPFTVVIDGADVLDIDWDAATIVNNLCYGDTDGSVSVLSATSGGWGDYIFTIDGDLPVNYQVENTTGIFENLPAGGYSMTVEDDSLGCLLTEMFSITQPDELGLDTEIAHVSCNGLHDGVIRFIIGGGTAPFLETTNNVGEYTAIEDIPAAQWYSETNRVYDRRFRAGEYETYIKDANGCITGPYVNTILEPAELELEVVKTIEPDCSGGDGANNNGEIWVTPKGGWFSSTDGFMYTVKLGATSYVVDSGAVVKFTGLSALNYPITVWEHNSSIDNNPIITNSNYFAKWTDGDYDYQLPWQNSANGCFTAINVDLLGPDPIVYENVDFYDEICHNTPTGAIDLQNISGGTKPYTVWVEGPLAYRPDNSGIGEEILLVDGIVNLDDYKWIDLVWGHYTIFVKDANDCQIVRESGEIATPDSLMIVTTELVENALCNGYTGTIEIHATGGFGSYEYAIAQSLVPFDGDHPFPPDGTVWQDSPTFEVLAATYTSWVRDANGCITGWATDANGDPILQHRVTVHEPTLVVASGLGTDGAECYGETDGMITYTGLTGGNGPDYTAIVTDTAGVQKIYTHLPTTNGSLPGLAAGTYTVVFYDYEGCASVEYTETVGQPNEFVIVLKRDQDAFICHDDLAGIYEIEVISGGTPFGYDGPGQFENPIYEYKWHVYRDAAHTDEATELFGAWGFTSTFQGFAGYYYVAYGRDANGCVTEGAETYVQAPELITFELAKLTCYGDEMASARVTATGTDERTFRVEFKEIENDIVPDDWSIYNGWFSGSIDLMDTFMFDNEEAPDYHYLVRVRDDQGCTSDIKEISFDAVQNPIQLFVERGVEAECTEEVTLNVVGGTAPYVVTVNGDTITEMTLELAAGDNEVVITDAHLICTITETVTVVGNPVIREATIVTFVGEAIAFSDAEAGLVDTMLYGGIDTFVYTHTNGCERTLKVTVVEVPREVVEVETLSPTGTITGNHPEFVITTVNDVTYGVAGNLIVTAEGATDATLEIPITAGMIAGNVVTVTYVYDAVAGGLDKNTTYFVNVDAGILVSKDDVAWDGISDNTTWTFTTGDFATPVNPDFNVAEFKVYPNPFSNTLNIKNSDKLTRVIVSNIAGQRVIDVKYPNSEIRTDNLVSGIYLISLFTEEGIAKTEKIIKK